MTVIDRTSAASEPTPRAQAKPIAFTKQRVPIGAWMFQGNPALSSVAAHIADAPEDDRWRWSCHPTYRPNLVQPGHPCLFWVTANDNPALVSGIWLAGEAIARCEDGPHWNPGPGRPAKVPYATLHLSTLARAISREDLLAHPVLNGLEVLRMPGGSNPLIVTPEQLDALRQDFGLDVAPLADDLRDAIRPKPELELWLAGPGGIDIEIYRHPAGWSVWADEEQLSDHEDWRDAYADAFRRAEPDLTITVDPDDPTLAAELFASDGSLWIIRTGDLEYKGYLELDGEDAAFGFKETFATLDEAVLRYVDVVWPDDAAPADDVGDS